MPSVCLSAPRMVAPSTIVKTKEFRTFLPEISRKSISDKFRCWRVSLFHLLTHLTNVHPPASAPILTHVTTPLFTRWGGGAGPGDGIKESPVAVLSSVGPHSPVSCAVIPVTMRILLIHAVSLFVCSFVFTVFEQMFFYWGFSYMFTCVFSL